jgi:HEAT repeat protein
MTGDENEARLRAQIMLASYANDEQRVREFLNNPAPRLRASALSALVNMEAACEQDGRMAVQDPEPIVRIRACELAPKLPGADYKRLLSDKEYTVIEAACFAVGEMSDGHAVPKLQAIALKHKEPICRESAVAALGAIGVSKAIPCLIEKLNDSHNIRRRAVLALSVFIDDDDALAAIRSRSDDRDWQVRQIVETILFK